MMLLLKCAAPRYDCATAAMPRVASVYARKGLLCCSLYTNITSSRIAREACVYLLLQ